MRKNRGRHCNGDRQKKDIDNKVRQRKTDVQKRERKTLIRKMDRENDNEDYRGRQ